MKREKKDFMCSEHNIGVPRNVIIRPEVGLILLQEPTGLLLSTLSQGQSSAQPIITAGFALLSFCGFGLGGLISVLGARASNETVE